MVQKTKTSAADTATTDTLGAMLKLQEDSLAPLRRMGSLWLEASADMGVELATFLADRIREDVRTQHEVLHCKDPSKLQEIQTRFLETAFEQYSAETGKMVERSQHPIEQLTKPDEG